MAAYDGGVGDHSPNISRRAVVAALGSAVVVGPSLVRRSFAALSTTSRTPGSLGPLGDPDDLGVQVPIGFRTTLVGRSGDPVGGTSFLWHDAPDGAGCIALAGGAHVLVSNSEVGNGAGGASAVEFDAAGEIVAARTILSGTSRNCAGGVTPWGTWLSCEENGDVGEVWECDPVTGRAERRSALGRFNHEAAAVDPSSGCVYLTEDRPDGRLYRWTPERPGHLDHGVLEAAGVDGDRLVWHRVASDAPDRSDVTSPFDGGEGLVIDHRTLFMTTKGDRRVWSIGLDDDTIEVLHDAVASPATTLTHVDNVAVHPYSRHLFVAEDGGNMELCVLVPDEAQPVAVPVVRFVGHDGSEVTGPAFSPDGRHLYVTSQRGVDGRGVTVRVSGPWTTFASEIAPASVRRSAVRLR